MHVCHTWVMYKLQATIVLHEMCLKSLYLSLLPCPEENLQKIMDMWLFVLLWQPDMIPATVKSRWDEKLFFMKSDIERT